MSDLVRVAAGQTHSVHGDVAANLKRAAELMRAAAAQGVQLLVLPECFLTSYVYDSADAVQAVAIPIAGPELDRLAALAQELDLHVVVGLLEASDSHPGAVHNTAVLIPPSGELVPYRKTHLPSLGADRFVTPGENGPVVVDTPLGCLGLSICYDLRFPEWARGLALEGADIIVNPTNWPVAAEQVAELFTRVRAAENRVFVIVANRGDDEKGVPFIGGSQIVGHDGTIIAIAERGEALVVADIDPRRARDKDIVLPDGDFAVSLFSDRRPNLYRALVDMDKAGASTDQSTE